MGGCLFCLTGTVGSVFLYQFLITLSGRRMKSFPLGKALNLELNSMFSTEERSLHTFPLTPSLDDVGSSSPAMSCWRGSSNVWMLQITH